MKQDFSPPEHLSDRAKNIWAELVPARARSIGRLTLLASALEALDRAETARIAIQTTGLTTTTKTTGAIHLNPLVKLERESRQQFARIWSDMSLGYTDWIDGIDLARWLAKQELAS